MELSHEAKAEIRRYVLLLVSVPGAAVSILLFFLGWMINAHFGAVSEAEGERDPSYRCPEFNKT